MAQINSCDYLLGQNDSIVVVVSERLPKDEPLTIQLQKNHLTFRAGEESIGEVDCLNREALSRLMSRARVGLVEIFNGQPQKAYLYIAAVADIQVMAMA